jgi:TPR repeat protein
MQQVKPESPSVLSLFLRACRLGDSSACTNAAAGRKSMDECSVRTFERTCEQTGDAWGCAMLGLALAKGEGIARDVERARTVLRKACEKAQDDPACAAATRLLGQIAAGK